MMNLKFQCIFDTETILNKLCQIFTGSNHRSTISMGSHSVRYYGDPNYHNDWYLDVNRHIFKKEVDNMSHEYNLVFEFDDVEFLHSIKTILYRVLKIQMLDLNFTRFNYLYDTRGFVTFILIGNHLNPDLTIKYMIAHNNKEFNIYKNSNLLEVGAEV